MISVVIAAITACDILDAEDNPKESTVRAKKRSPFARHVLDLNDLAKGVVPAHGLRYAASSIARESIRGRVFGWAGRLLGAVAVASMIALGLFVYTEFTATWQKRGLPTIPISALAAMDNSAQRGPAPSGPANNMYETRGRPTTTAPSLYEDYRG